MDMSQTTTEKTKMLSGDKLSLENPKDIFTALCENGAQKPMTEEEIDVFVYDVRKSKESDLNSFFGCSRYDQNGKKDIGR